MIIAKSQTKDLILLPKLINRHGLISGSTGTGKTVTVRQMAESLSRLGVPSFHADVKSDLSGLATSYPVIFWDLYGRQGHPIRTTIQDIGPLLLSRLLDLNRVQTGVMTLAFKVAREHNDPATPLGAYLARGHGGVIPESTLLSLGCLKLLLKHLADNAFSYTTEYGNITYTSVGAIQRSILELEEQGVNQFFNLPKFDVKDFFYTDDESGGRGVINILDATTLIQAPKLYTTFLLWLLSEIYETLPEVGDLEKPQFVFFFDEAHLLFNDIPKILLSKIELIVRLIRSKGVGVYFATQNPLDIPKTVLAQLGNRVQHALRAFTPEDYAMVQKVAKTFRPNPNFKTVDAITNMGTGEALVSFLQPDGSPGMVERAKVVMPESRLKPLTDEEKQAAIKGSPLYGRYENQEFTEEEKNPKPINKERSGEFMETMGRGVVKNMGNQVGREIVRGFFNTFFRGVRSGVGR